MDVDLKTSLAFIHVFQKLETGSMKIVAHREERELKPNEIFPLSVNFHKIFFTSISFAKKRIL